MLDFNLTLVLVFASFLVFMFAMKAIFFDPVRRIKILREQKIKLDQISVEELQQELDALTARIHHQVKEARLKAQSLLTESQASAKNQATGLVQEARTEASSAHSALQAQLEGQRQTVLNDLSAHKPELVNLLVQRLRQVPDVLVGGPA